MSIQKTIGLFIDEIEAAHAYDAYAIRNDIHKVVRNFPHENKDDLLAAAAVVDARRADFKKRKKSSPPSSASMSEMREREIQRDQAFLLAPSRKTSRFRGVGWHKASKKFAASISVGNKRKSLGIFVNEIDAAHAYDAYAIANGINRPRNFPSEDDVVRAPPKQRKKAANKSSKYRGVSWFKRDKKWCAQIQVDGKKKHIGSYPDEITAARAYDAFVIAEKLNKLLNFPGDVAAKGHVVTLSKTTTDGVIAAVAASEPAAKKQKVASSMDDASAVRVGASVIEL